MAFAVRQIKEALVSTLANTSGVSSRVYDSLTYSPTNITYPFVDIDIDSDTEVEENRTSSTLYRQCEAVVRIRTKKSKFEDALDTLAPIEIVTGKQTGM